MTWYLLLYYALVSAILAGVLAASKKRDALLWVICSFFLGIFAFLLLWALPEGEEEKSVPDTAPNDFKDDVAVKVKQETDGEQKPEPAESRSSLLPFVIVVIVGFLFLWLIEIYG
jgi:hypothetical protein